jgi:hypothetical protein
MWSSDVLGELETAKSQVEYLLENYPNCRNNDFYLFLLWIRRFGGLSVGLPFIPYEDVKSLSGKQSTLSRVRRKIQHGEGRFLPTDPEVLEKRLERAEGFRREMHKV